MTRWISGQFLIASPYLSDANFFRSIVYVIRHDAEGAFGVVINRPSSQTVVDGFAQLLGRDPKRNDPIYVGGPVNGPLVALHRLAGYGDLVGLSDSPGSNQSTKGATDIWITADEDHLRMLVDRPDVKAKFIARYSGWGPSQLDQEIEAGGWMIGACDESILFDPHDAPWETVVKRLGNDIVATVISQKPVIDPGRN